MTATIASVAFEAGAVAFEAGAVAFEAGAVAFETGAVAFRVGTFAFSAKGAQRAGERVGLANVLDDIIAE